MSLPTALEDALTLPLIGSPLFIVSNPELVLAQCKAGIIGSFPALNARPQPELADWLSRINDSLAKEREMFPDKKIAPYAVNQICHASNTRLAADMETCVRFKVPIVITSLRPPTEVVDAVHSYGGLVFHDVINVRHARKAAEQGVDGIIAVCAGAGGHAGTLSPFALINEIREFFDGVLILAGAMSRGSDILAAKAMGADLAYIGSRFVASNEANAVPEYKQMIVESRAADIAYSSLFTGIAGSYLKGSIENAGLDPEALPEGDKASMDFGQGDITAAKAWKDIWGAGQGVGSVKSVQPAAGIIAQMITEYDAAREKLVQL